MDLLDYLARGNDLEPLLVGKIGPQHVSIVKELQWRKVLSKPPLRPRYLDDPLAKERLERLRRGRSLMELIKEKNK